VSPSCDAVVIGGGIMGCCTAFELSKRGLEVVLVEKGAIGMGPTGQSSAIIRQHYSNELTARMAVYGLRTFQSFDERVGGECGFRQTGFVLMTPIDDRQALEANLAMQQELGIHTELLSSDGLEDLVPGIEEPDRVLAAYEPEGGYADPYLTVNAYAAAARRHGARILQDTEVTAISFEGDRVVGIDSTKGSMDAPAVVNCAGPWGARVAAMAGVELSIVPCRVQVVTMQRPEELGSSHPVVVDFVHGGYLRPETGDLLVAGLLDPLEPDTPVDPDSFDVDVDRSFQVELAQRLSRRLPALEHCGITGGYASLYDVTPDWHPVLDEVPPSSGFYLCTGFSGHGFKLGPAVGMMMADLVIKEGVSECDPYPFRLGRFAEHDLVRAAYSVNLAG
jgi:glycine/D-amino acid oxidase-like deaminating enzyme